jgi:hypothetical protein
MRQPSPSWSAGAALAALLAAASALGGCGCESESPVVVELPTASGGAAGAGAATSTNSTSSTSTSAGGTGPCPPEQPPPVVPEGWVEYTDWSCDCRFYVPGSEDAMPSPIQWEPCPEAPGGMDCRMMAIDWADGANIGTRPKLDVSPSGTVLSLVRAVPKDYIIAVVADIDGPVRSAMMMPLYGKDWVLQGCKLHNEAIGEGKYLLKVYGKSSAHSEPTKDVGVIAGPIGLLHPPVIARYENEDPQGWACGANWLAKETSSFVLTAHPWDMSEEIFVTSAATDPEHLHAIQLVVSGDALFWTTSASYTGGINVWDPLGGTRPFIRWVGDYTRGAAALATDGVDMVWLQGEGKDPNSPYYPTLSVMTAPFTTDPDALEPRRLRSHTYSAFPFDQIKVGCGHAVTEGGNVVAVVRLSDGWAWHLPDSAVQDFAIPVGVTCEDVFVAADIEGTVTVARIRLDSLGPGLPPD